MKREDFHQLGQCSEPPSGRNVKDPRDTAVRGARCLSKSETSAPCHTSNNHEQLSAERSTRIGSGREAMQNGEPLLTSRFTDSASIFLWPAGIFFPHTIARPPLSASDPAVCLHELPSLPTVASFVPDHPTLFLQDGHRRALRWAIGKRADFGANSLSMRSSTVAEEISPQMRHKT